MVAARSGAARSGEGLLKVYGCCAHWWLLKVVLAWLLCVLVAAEGVWLLRALVAAEGGAGVVAVRSGGC
jgi:hypothetical protein